MLHSKPEILRNFSYNLQRLRKRMGWTKYELARRAGMVNEGEFETGRPNVRAITQFERAERGCTFEMLANLAEALGSSIDELLLKRAPVNFEPENKKKRKKSKAA